MKNKKGALEFSFTWIFAIVAGMFILFLAIYGVSKFISIEQSSQDAQTAMDIGILTNPLESSFESSKRSKISTSVETRIYLGCQSDSFFGKQTIKTSQKTLDKWSEEGVYVGFPNKYIFSENPVEGRNFYLFSKPFEFPFKVADLIYLTSTEDKYCFKDSPEEIEDEIKNLIGENPSSSENFFIEDCPLESINVCFKNGKDCDIKVYTGSKYVEKDGEKMYYETDALMYAAIFSNKEYYECQLNRIMKRLSQLLDIYKDKSGFIFLKTGCNSDLNSELVNLGNLAKNMDNSEDLYLLNNFVEDIRLKNEYGECGLW